MARPRKPTAELEQTGAFKKNPQRRRDEPKPTGPLGAPPDYLTSEEKLIWAELATIIPPRVLTNADRWLVELACRLMARQRKDGIGGRAGLNTGELVALANFLAKMGMTPSDRSKVGLAPGPDHKDANEFSEFAQPADRGAKVQ